MASRSLGASVLVLLGPTATGKTAIGVEVAKRLGGEIVSADSRAFFEGLDIVTAKPTVGERCGIHHHLIDRVPIDQAYDAMAFRRDVERLIPEILERGRVPMLVGGGTLYLGAILRGIFEGPSKDSAFRETLIDQPASELHERLRAVDAEAARGIHPNDRLRIVRALEVFEASGRPISRWQTEATSLPYDFAVFGLQRQRTDHRAAIRTRVQQMLDQGLVGEVARLREIGWGESAQAYRTIGVPEAAAYLDGEMTKTEMTEAIVRQTWSLARRQTAWFRRDRDVIWLDVTGCVATDIADEIAGYWKERAG